MVKVVKAVKATKVAMKNQKKRKKKADSKVLALCLVKTSTTQIFWVSWHGDRAQLRSSGVASPLLVRACERRC